MNLILHSITSQGKYTSLDQLPDARFDIRFNIIIGIIITASILITSGTVLYGTGTSVNGALTFTKSLEPVLGSWARVVGDIGLLAAGLSSAIAVGFTFKTYHPYDMLDAVWRALGVYFDKEQWSKVQQNGMKCDFGWKASAKKYSDFYESL